MNRLQKILLLLLFLPAAQSMCQFVPEKGFTAYTTADGLSGNTVTGIKQDKRGYIWVTTLSGLSRFDGSRFVQYHSSNDSLSPASEEMTGMTWIDEERIGVFNVGLYIINTRTGERKNLFIPYKKKQYEYKFNMIVAARGDKEGNLYLLSRSGFYHFDKNYKLLSRFDYYSDEQVVSLHFIFGRELLELDQRRFLINSVGGLYIYDKQTRQCKKMEPSDCPPLASLIPSFNFSRFFQLNSKSIMVIKTNSDSIYYINATEKKQVISKAPFLLTEEKIHYRSRLAKVNDTAYYITGHISGYYKMKMEQGSGLIHLLPEKYFPGHQCTNMLSDRDDKLWVATTKGLFKQDPMRSLVQVLPIPQPIEQQFPGIQFSAVYTTAGKIYAGTRAKGGLLIYNKATGAFEKQVIFSGYSPLNNASIYKISAVDPSTLLLGTGGPLFLYNEKTGRETKLKPPGWSDGDWTNDFYIDSRNNTWISSHNIYRYDPVDGNFSRIPAVHSMPVIPVAIREDNNGNMWVAGHGIIRYNTTTSGFDREIDSFPFIKMPDKQVTAMVIDKKNTIWFSSFNNGLVSYDIDKRTFRHFSRSNGLPDDNISSLIIVGHKLWIACYSGMACLDLISGQIKSFGKEEGFPDMPVIKGSQFFYDSTERKLYLGCHNAIVRFDPGEVLAIRTSPSLFIENLEIVEGKSFFLPGDNLRTSWRENDIRIHIGSINFSDGNNQAYAYRLFKDINSPWQELGSQPAFNITNLSPGKHRIQVKIFSKNNRWPEQVKEFVMEVLPPFWKKTWFILLAATLLLLSLSWLIRWRTGLARKKEMEKTQVQKLKADDYRNKLELEQISHYFSSSLANKKTEEEVLWDVAGNLIGRMNYVDCMIYLWDKDKTKMVQKAAYGPKGNPEYISSHVFDVVPGQGVVGHVMQTKQPLLIKDTREDNRYRVDEAIRLSEICVPIIHNNELLGIIDSEHHELNYFSERDIKILTTIATLIGNKLKQLESEKTLEVKQQEITNINEQLAEAKLTALQAQMNPHFVFNALNSIKRMILDSDNEKASRYLSKFALMIRMTLNHSRDIFVTLAENITYLETYLEMEQLRFDDTFNWTIDVAEHIDTSEIQIPSLMIQPLVENAIWHGLMPSGREKRLSIAFSEQQGVITCVVEDNGIGIRKAEKLKEQQKINHRSVGLENLRNRVKILNEKYSAGYSLVVMDLMDLQDGRTGTRATLQFNSITN